MATKQTQKEDRVNIVLPKDNLNPEEEVERVFINGRCTQIKRGEEVSVPRDVYDVLRNGKRI